MQGGAAQKGARGGRRGGEEYLPARKDRSESNLVGEGKVVESQIEVQTRLAELGEQGRKMVVPPEPPVPTVYPHAVGVLR